MTAREDAIQAVLAAGVPHHQTVIAAVVNAIPNDVLVRLAIERGALAWIDVGSDIDGSVFVYDGADIHETIGPHDSVLWPVDDN